MWAEAHATIVEEGMDAMMRSLVEWIVRSCVSQVRSWPWPSLLAGAGCGMLILALHQQFSSQLGTSRPVTTAACLAISIAWVLAWGVRRNRSATNELPTLQQSLGLPAVLVLFTVISHWTWLLHDQLFHTVVLSSRWTILAYALVWSVLSLGTPVWCIGRLCLESPTGAEGTNSSRPAASCVLGISLGLGLALFITWNSLYVTALIGGAVLLGASFWKHRTRLRTASPAGADAMLPGELSTGTASGTREVGTDRASDWESSVTAIACGGLSLWVIQVVELLIPATIFTLTAAVSGVLFGIACGCRLGRRADAMEPGAGLFVRCGMAVVLLFLCGGFSELVHRLLTLTGSVSQVWLLHMVRWCLIGGCTAAVGCVWALATSRMAHNQHRFPVAGRLQAWGLGILLAMVGGTLTTFLIPLSGLTITGYAWLWIIAGAQTVESVRYGVMPRNTLARGVVIGCLLALIAVPICSAGIKPELAGRLLFSSAVFQANQMGTQRNQLPFLDDARLEARVQGERGVYTVWKSSFARHQIRENGIPRGSLSTNSQVSPQDSSEIVLALLPLTLHEHPNRVALLGMGGSVPMQTCLNGPVQQLTVIENDPSLITLLKQITANTEVAPMWQDERLTLQTVDPTLWVATPGDAFDVVISNPEPSALVRGASQCTRDFYLRAARHLTAGGIFCQRFQYFDYGPGPLQTVAATLRGVFQNVIAVETGPGEIALLGTNTEAGFVRSDVVSRMQSAHCRDLMAQVGWDWSVMLTLAAYDNARLDKVLANGAYGSNTAANGRLSTQLPSELMRWAPKGEEFQQAVTAHAGKILDWLGDAGTDEDLLRRLAEVRGQQTLVANFPDQYWGYRSEVRKQISSRPLTRIQQVKYEQQSNQSEGAGLHPDDKRRLRYFQQLSKAIHTQDPLEIELLAEYAQPYDPLVSLFLHQELAEIAARVPALPPSLELTHRLHMLNFAPAFDHSVRNALAGLRLVLEKPECIATSTERWDTINGFLNVLQYRWQNRSPADNANARLAARDVEENIVLAERALQELPKLASDVGLSESELNGRQRVIERNLLAPLRDYRERLAPVAAKQRMDAMEAEVDGDLPSIEELQFPGSAAIE